MSRGFIREGTRTYNKVVINPLYYRYVGRTLHGCGDTRVESACLISSGEERLRKGIRNKKGIRMKLTDLKTADEVLAEALEADPELREEWDRLEFARTIASLVIAYRADHDLTQTQLARLLEMHQSAVARLESGEHEPTLPTLLRLARVLDTRFHIEITPVRIEVSARPSFADSVA